MKLWKMRKNRGYGILPKSPDRVFPATPPSSPPVRYIDDHPVGDVPDLIIELALDYSVDPVVALRIAECESNFRPDAQNPHSTAQGVYQWLEGTWANIGSPGDRMNAEDNIRAFMVWYPQHPQ